LAVLGAILFKFAGVDHAGDYFAHVVLLGGVTGEDAVDFLSREERIARRYVAENGRVRRTDFISQRSDAGNARVVVRLTEIHGAADLRVHLGAAELFGG